MKLSGISISVYLILLVTSILFLNYLLPPIFQYPTQLSSSHLFLFSLLNTIILATIVGSFKPHAYEADDTLSFFGSHEVEENTYDNSKDNSDVDEDEDESCYGADGYEEDVEDNCSDDEVGWDDEEGYDDNLQKRIEDFIAKVNDGWREEKIRDKLSPG